MTQEERKAWHPGACSAIELDLRQYKKYLQYDREFQLNKEPLRADLLIIKKDPDIVIENDIGRIFSRYNLVEYKSPEDSLSIDDFFKVLCYACYYKSQEKTVGERSEKEITVSLLREGYPKKLIEHLRQDYEVEEAYPGIYYVERHLFRCQIVVTSRLAESHSSLRILSNHAERQDIRHFFGQAETFDKEDRENADSLLEVCTPANEKLIEHIKKEEPEMCEALRRIMKDEIEESHAVVRAEGRAEGREEGRAEGQAEGKLKTLIDLVQEKLLSPEDASRKAGMSLADFEALLLSDANQK